MNYSSIFENGSNPEIGMGCILKNDIIFNRFITIGNNTEINSGVKLGFNTKIGNNVSIGEGTAIGDNVVIWDNVTIGNNTKIENNIEIGYANLSKVKKYYKEIPSKIGNNCIIRSGAVIYKSSSIGDNCWIGNYTVLRENTIVGNSTTFGSNIMCEGYTKIGNNVKIYSFCELGGNMIVEDYVFIGPGVVTANNPKPLLGEGIDSTYRWEKDGMRVADCGPTIRKGAKVGIGATLLAEIEIGVNSLVAAGAVATKDVAPNSIVGGVPAKVIKKMDKL